MDLFCSGYLWIFFAVILYGLSKIVPCILLQQRLDDLANNFVVDFISARWEKSKCPKDIIVLHGIPRGRTTPCYSPFVFKLETFLRMAKIPYQYDDKDYIGPKGKTPWITLNGEHIADSQLCIEFLSKKYDINLNGKYSEKELAIGNAVRIMLEDHCFWEIALWAFVWSGERSGFSKISKWMQVSYPIMMLISNRYKGLSWAQGMGRHAKEDVERWTIQDIRNLSVILGQNKFLLGDEPCVLDCSFFGFCSQFFWGFLSLSHYATMVNDEMPQIKEYCLRMKEIFYPDWDELLKKKRN